MALSIRDRTLLRLCVAMVLGRWELLAELRRAAPQGEPDRAWREAALQTHLFAGFPRMVEALGVLDAEGGLGELEPGEELYEPDAPERGRGLFETVYADRAPAVLGDLERYHPVFAGWILGHAYGRVLGRPGLPADRRELLAVVCLAALGQDRQLASHVRGALRCGATSGELSEALEEVACLLAPERLIRARGILARFSRDC